MPVGTGGSVKGVHQKELSEDIQAQIILGNTYHLFLRPGTEIIEKAGGLHKFISWDRPMLTDSGGYQVYSLSGSRKINEEGVKFQSHIDGSYHFFTPERAIEIQRSIGADIIMAFDECTPYPCDYNYAKKSMQMTHRWLHRCFEAFNATESKYGYNQTLFPIVQGSTYKDLRTESAETIASFGADGNAIGGLSVGEPEDELYEMTESAKMKRIHHYKESTPIMAYYILKSICMMNVDEFIEWTTKSNKGSLNFRKTESNIGSFIHFIRERYNREDYIKAM
jgi:queuine tRNA-ribosyltransferase